MASSSPARAPIAPAEVEFLPAVEGVKRLPISWPHGKSFAFSIFDDPDAQTLQQSRLVYDFLTDIGMSTTKGVWVSELRREANSPGDTCANPAYLGHVLELQNRGFEIGYHHAAPHNSTREETRQALLQFRTWFGGFPLSMANHYNADALYWGGARLSGIRRTVYEALKHLNRNKTSTAFTGHIPGSEFFWGDMAREWIRYCRNFVYRDINTLRACPHMPYHDAQRPYVQQWFGSSDGNCCPAFLKTISEANQDRLEEQGGACIMYAHFGHGFVEEGALNPTFRSLMLRLSRKQGWFIPVSKVLDHLGAQSRGRLLPDAERSRLERTWLLQKFLTGTT
jgi:hypothetical protein